MEIILIISAIILGMWIYFILALMAVSYLHDKISDY